jgi:hypothetical protein
MTYLTGHDLWKIENARKERAVSAQEAEAAEGLNVLSEL